MKARGILHSGLSGALARLGHTDGVVVADCGLPVPPGPDVIDLAFSFGVPSLAQVLDGLLGEIVVEAATVATEVDTANPACAALFDERVPGARRVSHEEFKRLVAGAKLVVRTGEATPYANVLLRCGVPF
ncbi:D-ribose pyranase [Goodfellowiella coeruleoviolacea]|uniref:D-ribose pyranase n=1 Tax=Goodfellowiella coeruleoviolacea TaxID=334858 RepID=A0AAE3KK26_9PSEU|nr:D-ribose pyranase [Goodfellowiella coeruleoviolacea]MCP2168934.1 D-ribose pyranase [Goodfellowiella coeruleoviolacea]